MVKIIVIEDDPDSQEVYSDLLDLQGFVIVAKGANGKDAIELYKKYSPDLVIMDVLMDKYDGFYGLDKIRKFDPAAKIILITAGLAETEQKRLLKTEASALIFKPIEREHFFKTIDKVLSGKRVIPKSVRSITNHTSKLVNN